MGGRKRCHEKRISLYLTMRLSVPGVGQDKYLPEVMKQATNY